MSRLVVKIFVFSSISLAVVSHATRGSAMDRTSGGENGSRASGKISSRPVPGTTQVQIPEDQARSIALNHIPGIVKEVELEHDHGLLVYSIEIAKKDGKKIEARIDAASGAFLGTESDHEDNEDSDEDD